MPVSGDSSTSRTQRLATRSICKSITCQRCCSAFCSFPSLKEDLPQECQAISRLAAQHSRWQQSSRTETMHLFSHPSTIRKAGAELNGITLPNCSPKCFSGNSWTMCQQTTWLSILQIQVGCRGHHLASPTSHTSSCLFAGWFKRSSAGPCRLARRRTSMHVSQRGKSLMGALSWAGRSSRKCSQTRKGLPDSTTNCDL